MDSPLVYIAGIVITLLIWIYCFYRCEEDITTGWLFGFLLVSLIWPLSIIPTLIALLHATDIIDIDNIINKIFGTTLWRWKK